MHRLCRTLSALFCLALPIAIGHADTWERFRGPNGAGTVASQDIPVNFDAKSGILWKVPLSGNGNSSPVVWENRLFVQATSVDGKERTLLCVDTDKGSVLWAKTIPATTAKTHEKGSLASSTPATDGEIVCVAYWDGTDVILHTYDFTGASLWHKNLGKFTSEHGPAASPIIYKDKVIYAFDSDNKAILFALNKKDGTIAWEAPRKSRRASYSSPIFRTPSAPKDAATEMILASTTGVTGYNPDNGQVLWDLVPKFPASPLRLIATPTLVDNSLILSSGDGSSGLRYTFTVDLHGQGRDTKPTQGWDAKKDVPYVTSSVSLGGYLYIANDPGFVGCYELKTGTKIWYERIPDASFIASPVLIGDHMYVCSEEGDVYVFHADPKYQLLAKNSLGEMIHATPAVADNRLYIRGEHDLFCIGKK